MNSWACQHSALMESCGADGVVCPKPRRISAPPMQFWQQSRRSDEQTEVLDSRAGMELLDIIQMKGNHGYERSTFQVVSSSPFFAGSPPSRVSNPIIQDENFSNNNGNPFSPMLEAPSSTRRSGACTRVNFSSNPAPVRIEGFNCPGTCRISAVA